MNWVDFTILALLVGGFLWSFKHGLIMEIINFVAALGGLTGAFIFYPYLQSLLEGVIANNAAASTVAFIGVFVLVAGAITLLGYLVQKFIYMIQLGFIDRLLGGLFGMVKIAMIVGVALVMFIGVRGNDTPDYIEQSKICEPVVNVTTGVVQMAPPMFESFHRDYGQAAMQWLRHKRNQVQ